MTDQPSLFSQAPPGGEQLPRDGSAVLHPAAFTTEEADRLFARLLDEVPWSQQQVRVYGRVVDQPRLTAWFGDDDTPYTYSGLTLHPEAWTPALDECRRRCEQLAGVRFNSGLANLYRDGQDTVGWHSDDEPELGPAPVIASVSFGATRRFDLRHVDDGHTVRLPLTHGSILVMSGRSQSHWRHQIARTRRVTRPRINLTFRQIRSAGDDR